MKFQILAVSALLLSGSCLMAHHTMVKDSEPMMQESAECECLAMPTPMLEKVATKCSVVEKAPAHCFKVEKVVTTDEVYRIPSHSKHACTISDENGTRPCCGETIGCGCKKECPKKECPKCEKPERKHACCSVKEPVKHEKKCCPAKPAKKCCKREHKCHKCDNVEKAA